MGIFDKNKIKITDENEQNNADKITTLQLNENDLLILEKINLLQQSFDGMKKDNKKALMMGAMNDEKIKKYENKIVDMKLGIIRLLDQIDDLISAVATCEVEYLKQGLVSYNNKVTEIANSLEIEVLDVAQNMKFNPRIMDAKEKVSMEEFDDDVVVDIYKRGYRDSSNGNILRYAIVSVNKL